MTTRTGPLKGDHPIESRDDLLAVFSGGEKARDQWRFGSEQERCV